ncbi:TPA: hypothetical protein I7766_21950, partial [Vibrio vulnificus]|nr:hypothetical protein [Vibrio parahaemolyticus]HAS8475061.1 hypothetical protein [Vibrio vulnificus]
NMEYEITPIISASIALFGVFAGSCASYFASASIKKKEMAHQLSSEFARERRQLYSQFLSESNSAALQALTDKSDANVRLQKVAGLLSQVQLVSSDAVYKKAVDMFEILINMYSVESAKDTDKVYADFRELFVIVARAELGLRS